MHLVVFVSVNCSLTDYVKANLLKGKMKQEVLDKVPEFCCEAFKVS